MADPVSIIVGPILAYTVNVAASLLTNKLLSFFGVEKELEKLRTNLVSIQAVVKGAEERQLQDEFLKVWLGRLKDAAFDAADLLDSFQTDASMLQMRKQQKVPSKFHLPITFPFSISKASYKKKFQDISSRVDEINLDKLKFNLVVISDDYVRPTSHSRDRLTLSYVDRTNVFGREGDREKIVEMLKSDSTQGSNISIIPIIGMGGLGKTTLAQLVYNDEWTKGHFDLGRMWVCVTQDFNLISILRKMIESYSKMPLPNDLSPEVVVSRFRDFLPGKRFVLVLDDVWTSDYNKDWKPLLELLELGLPGSKILVTSRDHKVARILGTPPFLLELLPDDKCWELFEKIAFTDDDLPGSLRRDLEKIGKQIVSKCKGLPLAVKAMGGLLRADVDKNRWQRILNSSMWELDDQNIQPALKLSYDGLPSYLKQCFAYCSIFPKAYSFEKKEMVQLWMAEALIHSKKEEKVEEIGMEYFNGLLVKSFFQRFDINNKERYRMHDLIHDLALSVSRPYCYQMKDIKCCDVPHNCRYISLLCQDVEQASPQLVNSSKKLRTLLLPGDQLKTFGNGTLEKLFNSLKYIRVLDLSSSSLLQVPDSIEELKLLRYLDLSNTEIEELPNSMCNLYNLQTLKLLHCLSLLALPKDFGNLVNLQHLELEDMFWFKCKALPHRMGNLVHLHNLHAFQVGCESGYGVEELENMNYLTGMLHISKLENAVNASNAKLEQKEGLQKLVFEWSDANETDPPHVAAQEKVLEDLRPHSNVTELQVCNYSGNIFPTWLTDGLLENLAILTLKCCVKCKILDLGQLPHLRALAMKGLRELECLNANFPFLYRLQISDCPKLKNLPEVLPNLQVLKIKRCRFLKDLPVAPSLKFMILVDNLCLENWREMILRPAGNQNQSTNSQIKFSLQNLLELKIKNCPKFSKLPEVFAPQKLEISGCNMLTTLPSSQFSQRLQCLAIESSNNATILKAIPSASSLYSLVISKIKNLVTLPRWPSLPGLKALHVRSCEDLMFLSEGSEGTWQTLTSLQLLSIQDCPGLTSLPDEGLPASLTCLSIDSCPRISSLGPKDILKSLTSLQDLYIKDCPLINSLPEDGVPSSLQHLQIQNCPLLIERCQKQNGGGLEWPKISHIPDLEIDFIRVPTAAVSPVKNPSIPDLEIDFIRVPTAAVSPVKNPSWRRWFNLPICCTGIEKGVQPQT